MYVVSVFALVAVFEDGPVDIVSPVAVFAGSAARRQPAAVIVRRASTSNAIRLMQVA